MQATQRLRRKLIDAVHPVGLPSWTLIGIASAQTTLLFRADQVGTSIAAILIWMALAVLITEFQKGMVQPAVGLPLWRFHAGLACLGWCLLVLTFSARLYDPLMLLIPVVGSAGVALIEGLSWRSRTCRDLLLLALLLPLNTVIVRLLPTSWIVVATSQLSCHILNLFGKECSAQGNEMHIGEMIMRVDPPCAGTDTMALVIVSCIMFQILFPIRRHWLETGALVGSSIVIAFAANAMRVVILGLSSLDCDLHWYRVLCGFRFWHTGTGSHLFTLTALGGVCWLWWHNINVPRSSQHQL